MQEVQRKLWLYALEKGKIFVVMLGGFYYSELENFCIFFFWTLSHHCTEELHLEFDLLFIITDGKGNFYFLIRKKRECLLSQDIRKLGCRTRKS